MKPLLFCLCLCLTASTALAQDKSVNIPQVSSTPLPTSTTETDPLLSAHAKETKAKDTTDYQTEILTDPKISAPGRANAILQDTDPQKKISQPKDNPLP